MIPCFFTPARDLLVVLSHLRRRFARFKWEDRRRAVRSPSGFALPALSRFDKSCDRRFQLLSLFVCFEEFIEQHRVHLIVTHAVGFSFFVAHDQVRVHFFNVFGHKSELWCACRINVFLVAERDRFKLKECFAGFIHWPNIFFKAL